MNLRSDLVDELAGIAREIEGGQYGEQAREIGVIEDALSPRGSIVTDAEIEAAIFRSGVEMRAALRLKLAIAMVQEQLGLTHNGMSVHG